jgi:TolB protein
MDADGKNVRRLTNVEEGGICYFPTWSGQAIYLGYAPPKDGEGVIGRVASDGTGFEIVAPGRDPAISPDGKTIAFTQTVNKGYCLFRMNAQGGDRQQLTRHENAIGAVAPIWSPDGKKLLYSDEVSGKLEIFCCDEDGNEQRQLTKLGQFAASAAWSPDMKHISFRLTDYDYWRYPDAKEYIYREKKADKRPVWVMEGDGSNPHVLEVAHYHCAMDGSRAAWKPK